jgi:hypothetical protein
MDGPADVLVETLSGLLGIPAHRLNDDSDLLYLGLDSLRTMRAASQLRRAGLGGETPQGLQAACESALTKSAR